MTFVSVHVMETDFSNCDIITGGISNIGAGKIILVSVVSNTACHRIIID